jgi:hypothetical protein
MNSDKQRAPEEQVQVIYDLKHSRRSFIMKYVGGLISLSPFLRRLFLY